MPATPDVSACCAACTGECVGFTLFSGICYLKTAYASGEHSLAPNPGRVTYLRLQPPPPPQPSTPPPPSSPPPPPPGALAPAAVSVDGRMLLRGGAALAVRGVAYSPLISYARRDESPPNLFHHTEEQAALWARDLPKIKAAGANLIRVYNWGGNEHDDLRFLDLCASLGLYVMLPISNYFLDFPEFVEGIVRDFAAHPAVLMWGVSNEAQHGHGGTADEVAAAIAAANAKVATLTKAVRAAEEALGVWHPITVPVTCDLGHIDDLVAAGAIVDIWAFNCYWSATESWPPDFFAQFAAAVEAPVLISEFGCDAYDNRGGAIDETTQASFLADQWSNVLSPAASGCVSLGGVVFEYMDEEWKAQYAGGLGGTCDP